MRYKLSGRLVPMWEHDVLQDEEVLIEIITTEEYQNTYQGEVHEVMLSKSLHHMEYSKVDLLKNCAVGTFVIPVKDHLIEQEVAFGFYMSDKQFLFVDDSGMAKRIINDVMEHHIIEKTYVAHFLFEFMEMIISDDVYFLQQYEEKMSALEEMLLSKEIKNFDHKILKIRKEISRLATYYRQLVNICETLEENYNNMFKDEDCRLFSLLEDRITRLYEHSLMLREYSLQIREMYQSQIDIRQNKIMQFLTVVTTIFMPLTLIVGWYGMNFVNMPELKFHNGYYVVIAVSFVITLIEIWYFKIKNWFN